MSFLSIMVLQNYPVFKYSIVVRGKEIKQLANKNNNPKGDQPKNQKKENIKDSHQEVIMSFMFLTPAATKSVTKVFKKYWMKELHNIDILG